MLSKEQVCSIESKAQDVLSMAYDGKPVNDIDPPIDLVKIAQKLGLNIKVGQFAKGEISGAYKREEAAIYISESETLPRKLFTIAHELGHFILHVHKKDEVFYRSSLFNIDHEKQEEETEANWFAASLLMPRDIFIKAWLAFRDIDRVAAIFSVSHIAVYFRLKNLGLLN